MTLAYRRRFAVLASIAASALATACAPGVASAAPSVDATCVHPAALTFTPGLQLTPRPTQIHASGTLSTCVSSQVTSGTLAGDTTGSTSCTTGSITGQLLYQWHTTFGGEAHSTVTLSTEAAGFLGAALTGTVTDGLFYGDTYTVSFSASPLQLLGCLSPDGLTQMSGVAASTFSHL
jgi:hypothetical protein